MKMRRLNEFLNDESGLTTIEWVSLCAVVLIAAIAISSIVLEGADALGGAVATQMEEAADEVSPP
jgi:Flp pilus assembly pilin Flp